MKKRKLRVDRLMILILGGVYFITACLGTFNSLKHLGNLDKNAYNVEMEQERNNENEFDFEEARFKEELELSQEMEQLEKQNQEERNLIYKGTFKLTGYCSCEKCCGEYAGGPTASGVMPKANHTIAADPFVLPIGTHVIINNKEYVVEDTGSAVNGNVIDIYNDTHSECFGEHCNGYADVYIIEGE